MAVLMMFKFFEDLIKSQMVPQRKRQVNHSEVEPDFNTKR
jgi:hypothetical protein